MSIEIEHAAARRYTLRMAVLRQSEIVLAAFNARYAHSAFGARYLLANLGPLKSRAALLEFDLQEPPRAAVEKILAAAPRIVAMGC